MGVSKYVCIIKYYAILLYFSVSEFETRFYNHRSYNKKYKGTDFAAPQCYDHVWIAALALNCTDTILTNIGTLLNVYMHNETNKLFSYDKEYTTSL
jgi:hypothetical protein